MYVQGHANNINHSNIANDGKVSSGNCRKFPEAVEQKHT